VRDRTKEEVESENIQSEDRAEVEPKKYQK